jgi:DNA-binding transcriptional regulator YhcF (GntR family)
MKSAAASASRLQLTSDSAAQQIEQALRRAIVTLELRPGKSLSENEVALRYGVSRQPAREAMIALAKIGLVRVLPQRGTVVVKISARQMMQVRFARESRIERFEPLCRVREDRRAFAAATGVQRDPPAKSLGQSDLQRIHWRGRRAYEERQRCRRRAGEVLCLRCRQRSPGVGARRLQQHGIATGI